MGKKRRPYPNAIPAKKGHVPTPNARNKALGN